MQKNKLLKKRISWLLVMVFLVSFFFPYAASYGLSPDSQNALEIVLTQGKGAFTANGTAIPCEKPYKSGNLLYIPLKAVLEAIGADVEASADGTVTVTYRDAAAKLKVGAAELTVNQTKKNLPAPPALSGNTIMVPMEFLKLCFDIGTDFESSTGKGTILLEDDGALSDLSFLTGSITTSKAGNSYFGWSISLPRGTRVASQSFQSKYVQFENDHYGFDLEINTGYNKGKSLKEYYDQIREDPYSLMEEEPMDTSLHLEAKLPYIELLYNDSYNEAVCERIYVKGSYYYDVIVTSYNEVDPFKLKNDKSVKSMLDSFGLSYNGSTADTADLSSVKYGLAKYSNYIASESTGKKYLAWEMDILPEWNLKSGSSASPFNTQFDGNPGEYIKVELDTAEEKTDIESIGKSIVESYARNFNPELFSLKSSGLVLSQDAGSSYYELRFEVKYGSKLYHYIERFFLDNGIVYDITFKSPADSSAKGLENFKKMIDSFRTTGKDTDKILDELQKNTFNQTKSNVGKGDTLSIYENKAFKWKVTLPGYWQKNSSSSLALENFYDSKSGALIAVEVSALRAGETAKTDRERFLSMRFSDKMPEKPVKMVNEQYKGRNMTTYQYRIEDATNETYANIYYYLFEEGGYKYCFMATIPDLTSSEYNLSSLKSIWESFEITK